MSNVAICNISDATAAAEGPAPEALQMSWPVMTLSTTPIGGPACIRPERLPCVAYHT